MQHSTNFKLKSEVSIFFKVAFVNPLPVPLISILKSVLVSLLILFTILRPSLILFEPPVKITIFELTIFLFFSKDKIFSWKLNKPTNFIFSSSCTVYGQAERLPITEKESIKKAESPYGNTKQICEEIIIDTAKSDKN